MRSDSGINCAHSLRTFRNRLILAVDAFSQQKEAWRPWQCCVEEHYLDIMCAQLFICRRLPVTDINYMYIHQIASTEGTGGRSDLTLRILHRISARNAISIVKSINSPEIK